MRYQKGSVDLRYRDQELLKCVADSRFITHTQLFEFARLSLAEWKRPVFNWRVRRLVRGALIRKQVLSFLGSDALYAISRSGVQALERLGTFYLGGLLDRDKNPHEFQIPHQLEINSVRLALMRTRALVHWIPECLVRVLNLSPDYAYAKVYDAIATISLGGGEDVPVAIERPRRVAGLPGRSEVRLLSNSPNAQNRAVKSVPPPPNAQHDPGMPLLSLMTASARSAGAAFGPGVPF